MSRAVVVRRPRPGEEHPPEDVVWIGAAAGGQPFHRVTVEEAPATPEETAWWDDQILTRCAPGCEFHYVKYFPKPLDVSNLVNYHRWSGFGLYSEQQELLERLRTRWEDGQDPGIPERVRRLV